MLKKQDEQTGYQKKEEEVNRLFLLVMTVDGYQFSPLLTIKFRTREFVHSVSALDLILTEGQKEERRQDRDGREKEG